MPKQQARKSGPYRVANPRGIPSERHVLRIGDRRWYEGDTFDGPVDERLVRDGFLVEVTDDEE